MQRSTAEEAWVMEDKMVLIFSTVSNVQMNMHSELKIKIVHAMITHIKFKGIEEI